MSLHNPLKCAPKQQGSAIGGVDWGSAARTDLASAMMMPLIPATHTACRPPSSRRAVMYYIDGVPAPVRPLSPRCCDSIGNVLCQRVHPQTHSQTKLDYRLKMNTRRVESAEEKAGPITPPSVHPPHIYMQAGRQAGTEDRGSGVGADVDVRRPEGVWTRTAS